MDDLIWNYTNDFDTAAEWLNNLPADQPIACDFETASMWTKAQRKDFESKAKYATKWVSVKLKQKSATSGLSHPALTHLTHFSCAVSRTEAFVIILDTDEMRQALLEWLVEDTHMQIWHNLSFDGRHIMYHTGKLPQHYEDSQILAKTLLNHVNTYIARTGLKELMGWEYGSWAISDEVDFELDNMYDERMLKYACIDAMATFGLWEDIQTQLRLGDQHV